MNQPSLFFKVGENQDPQDVYDQALFEDKQFFQSKAILALVFTSRIKKMSQRREAVMQLYPELEKVCVVENQEVTFPTNLDIQGLFENYFKYKNALLLELFRAQSIQLVVDIAQHLLEIQQSFAAIVAEKLVSNSDFCATDSVSLSKAADPSLLIKAIKSVAAMGEVSVASVFEKDYLHKEILTNELNRLFLQHQKENKNEHI